MRVKCMGNPRSTQCESCMHYPRTPDEERATEYIDCMKIPLLIHDGKCRKWTEQKYSVAKMDEKTALEVLADAIPEHDATWKIPALAQAIKVILKVHKEQKSTINKLNKELKQNENIGIAQVSD